MKNEFPNNDEAGPVLWLDLVLRDIREYLIRAIETKIESDRLEIIFACHEYVRGLADGNRFSRKRQKLIVGNNPGSPPDIYGVD